MNSCASHCLVVAFGFPFPANVGVHGETGPVKGSPRLEPNSRKEKGLSRDEPLTGKKPLDVAGVSGWDSFLWGRVGSEIVMACLGNLDCVGPLGEHTFFVGLWRWSIVL